MSIIEALNTVVLVAVVALLAKVLDIGGTYTLKVSNIDFTIMVPLTLGIALVCAVVKAVDGIFEALESLSQRLLALKK